MLNPVVRNNVSSQAQLPEAGHRRNIFQRLQLIAHSAGMDPTCHLQQDWATDPVVLQIKLDQKDVAKEVRSSESKAINDGSLTRNSPKYLNLHRQV